MDKDQPSKCYGTVHIKINGSRHPVCAKTWTDKNAQVVCRELKCGKVSFQFPVSITLIKINYFNYKENVLFNASLSNTVAAEQCIEQSVLN